MGNRATHWCHPALLPKRQYVAATHGPQVVRHVRMVMREAEDTGDTIMGVGRALSQLVMKVGGGVGRTPAAQRGR